MRRQNLRQACVRHHGRIQRSESRFHITGLLYNAMEICTRKVAGKRLNGGEIVVARTKGGGRQPQRRDRFTHLVHCILQVTVALPPS